MNRDFGSLHYNAIGPWLKNYFGQRVIKLSLDGGFTCPNRDGKVGTGGCIFCSEDGSGTFAGTADEQIKLLSRKWPEAKYIAYFQNHTNTYAPAEKLRTLYDSALGRDGMLGLAIATRPDCLGNEVLDLLSEYNEKTFLWVELGLQTSKESTGEYINRCFSDEIFSKACKDLRERNIRFVIHLIEGLPGESREDMMNSARFALNEKPFGLKLHMLHVMKGTRLAETDLSLMSMEEYISLICDILEISSPEVTIHRLTGDAPHSTLIAPEWTYNKHTVLNEIQKEFKRRGSFQGFRFEEQL